MEEKIKSEMPNDSAFAFFLLEGVVPL